MLPVPRGSTADFRIPGYRPAPDATDYNMRGAPSTSPSVRRPRSEREREREHEDRMEIAQVQEDQGGVVGPVRTPKRHHRSRRHGESSYPASDSNSSSKHRRSSSSPTMGGEPMYRMVTLFVDDQRDGRHYLTEVRVHVRPTHGGGWGNAREIAARLQSGPSRIDGECCVPRFARLRLNIGVSDSLWCAVVCCRACKSDRAARTSRVGLR